MTPATKRPFEYFAIRCVPRVDRGEFVNVGVVVYCQAAGFLAVGAELNAQRLAALDSDLDLDVLAASLATIDAICRGDAAAGEVAGRDLGKRFGWLGAPRSTVVQPGPTHGGLTADPKAELERLVDALVR